ncbi:MAG: phosphate ABC transporter substrate-binding protein [Oscillospiraceae bacterium]|nr:phosphate ABC transporter substrate-binding protein [Oscillospiraceae bacterium]
MKSTKITKRIAVIALSVVMLATATACGGSSGNSASRIVIAGSTSVQPFMENLVEVYEDMYPDYEVDVQGGGTSAGITAASSGTADIGMASRDIKDGEFDGKSVVIALDGLAVIVHPDNPVHDLTKEQIRDIYSHDITNWSEVGGPDQTINVVTREDGSGTRGAFEDLVMVWDNEGDKKPINPASNTQNSNGTVKSCIVGDVNAIGYISLGLVDETVQAVKLNGIEANDENVTNKTYALFRPFILVMKNDASEESQHFVDFVLSREGQDLLKKEHLIPVA